MDIENDATLFRGPVTIGTNDAPQIRELMYGTVSLDFTAGIAANAVASASASAGCVGLGAGAVVTLVPASADAGVNFVIQRVVATAGVITATAMNASGANKSAGAASGYNYFALR